MEKYKRNMSWFIGGGIFLILVIIVSLMNYFQSEPNMPNTSQIPKQIEPETPISTDKSKRNSKGINEAKDEIMVDVQGSVTRPGVYELKEGDRVLHAIQMAGGFTDGAEVRSVNQALKISDEMIVYVAEKGEKFELDPATASSDPADEKTTVININSADETVLQTLNGVGPAKAQSIISYREENGPFTSLEQLLEVRGIGEKTIEQWKDQISFE
ncbi:helix-hairpin-helix domain-containing protein [Fictibacillus norfolkensis]|uniref:Helix-hairpin-helix domain-containing protein n=1 Tax=Fictibacillus norfolkensis TaxID=2762233 RepID=A0ABR8SLR4_9BACL|nr:helix-hairpin-helix domain-containing protein [Fictibacillus norfolkensis]MBD7964432.1 helix-hairpin-helix domain-containing protein [Fictibacillus norfolkensis]